MALDIISRSTTDLQINNCFDVYHYFSKQKETAIKNLMSDTLHELISIDNSCIWNMGSSSRIPIQHKLNNKLHTNITFFKCKNCSVLEYLTNLKSAFPIKFKCNNTVQVIHEQPNVGIFSVRVDNIIYLDKFSCNALCNWYLEYHKNNDILTNYFSFVCRNNGYSITDSITEIPLNQLPDKYIVPVIIQMLNILKRLEPLQFSIIGRFGTLFIIDDKFKVRLNDLSKCTLGVASNRITSNDPTTNKVNIKKMKYYTLEGHKNLYIIGDIKHLLKSLHLEMDINRSSLNAYLVIYYLFSYKNILTYFTTYEQLYKIWAGLWINSDFKELKFTISDLERFRLREDALDYLLTEFIKL